MSLKKSSKSISKLIGEDRNEEKRIVKILIRISDLENVKYLSDNAVDLDFSAKFMTENLKSPEGSLNIFKSDQKKIQTEFEIEIDRNDHDEVFNLAAYPIHCKYFFNF